MARSPVVGIVLSLALHALIVAAFIAVMTGQNGRILAVKHAAQDVSVMLLAKPIPATAAAGSRSSVKHANAPPPILENVRSASVKATSTPTLHLAEQLSSERKVQPDVLGAAAASASVADLAVGEDYRERLQVHIAEYRRAPDRRAGGLVQVGLALDRSGDVLAVAVVASSGVPELDDEAVAMIWRARPMPPIPMTLPSRLAVTLPISFDTRRVSGVN